MDEAEFYAALRKFLDWAGAQHGMVMIGPDCHTLADFPLRTLAANYCAAMGTELRMELPA